MTPTPLLNLLRTFRNYRDGAYVTFPAIVEIDKFESALLKFLANRRASPSIVDEDEEKMHGMSVQWIGLLFASFASGAQFSSLPKRDRELLSQVYCEWSAGMTL